MKLIKSAIAMGAACLLTTGAMADGHAEADEEEGPTHFEYEAAISNSAIVGGVGDEIYGASWDETITITQGDDSFTITGKCTGMDSASYTQFDRHFVCTQQSESGATGAILFGCTTIEDNGSEMRCYGHFEGKSGVVEGHAAMHTAYYTFMEDGTGKVSGSGQWYK